MSRPGGPGPVRTTAASIYAVVAIAGACVPVPAQVALAQQWHGSVAATSDYVLRGVSQTQGDGALQADLHYQGQAGWFAGAWGSTIDSGYDGPGHFELDLYAGWNWQPAADWTARLAYARYLYPEASGETDYDYGELSARLAWRDRIVAVVAWAPDSVRYSPYGYDRTADAYAYELALRQPLGSRLAATLGAGWYDGYYGIDYGSWNLGLSGRVGPVELELAHFANDDTARAAFGRETAGDRWALTALWRF